MRGSKLAFVRYNSCFAQSLFVAFFLHFFVSFIRCCVLSACASLPVYLSMVRVCLFSVCLFCHHVSCRFSSGLHLCFIFLFAPLLQSLSGLCLPIFVFCLLSSSCMSGACLHRSVFFSVFTFVSVFVSCRVPCQSRGRHCASVTVCVLCFSVRALLYISCSIVPVYL